MDRAGLFKSNCIEVLFFVLDATAARNCIPGKSTAGKTAVAHLAHEVKGFASFVNDGKTFNPPPGGVIEQCKILLRRGAQETPARPCFSGNKAVAAINGQFLGAGDDLNTSGDKFSQIALGRSPFRQFQEIILQLHPLEIAQPQQGCNLAHPVIVQIQKLKLAQPSQSIQLLDPVAGQGKPFQPCQPPQRLHPADLVIAQLQPAQLFHVCQKGNIADTPVSQHKALQPGEPGQG